MKGTTVLAILGKDGVAMGADGQVTMGQTVMKGNAIKVRRMYEGKVLAGFAGATADAFALFEKFEGKLNEYSGDLARAAVELAKEWRTDRILRRLEALLIVADRESMFLISGTGDVIRPEEDGVLAIGSGGPYATAAAKARQVASLHCPQLDLLRSFRTAMGLFSSDIQSPPFFPGSSRL